MEYVLGEVMGEFLRNTLCFIGFHSWEWMTVTETREDGTKYLIDKGRCTNWRSKSHRWMIMNYERRPW